MKKGIVIAILITTSLILFKPTDIKASINNGWASELQALSRADYKSCTSDTTCTTALNVETDYITSPGYTDRAFILNSDLMTIGQNGYVIQSPVGTLKSGYLYNINYYLCHNKDFNSNHPFEIYASTYGSAINNKNTYNLTTRSALGQQPILDGGRTFDYCYLYSGLVVPDKNYTWTGYRIRSTSGTLSNVVISTIAVEVKELGIYTDTLKTLINDSGFATAESVSQVQDSVNRVEEAITGDHEYDNTPSEELEGKEEIDNLKNKEEELLGNLDFSGAENIEITIEPETANFIWQIVDALRSMSGKIVLLITSILGLGIIKMILNR